MRLVVNCGTSKYTTRRGKQKSLLKVKVECDEEKERGLSSVEVTKYIERNRVHVVKKQALSLRLVQLSGETREGESSCFRSPYC